MSKILKYILFRTVLVIISLHTIIPHPHSDELTEEEHLELHQKSNSLIGIIRLIFHESNDESLDNLIFAEYDYLSKIHNKPKYTNVSNFNSRQCSIVKNEMVKIINQNNSNLDKLLFVKQNRLRGPPMLS